jgi:hypothetical protein
MFEWSVVVLAETTTCRSRDSARGLEGAREQRVNKGLVGWLSSHDEHVRQRPPPASGDGSATQELERAFAADSRDGRHLDFVEAGCIDVRRWKRDQAAEQGRTERCGSLSGADERCQRARVDRGTFGRESQGVSPLARWRATRGEQPGGTRQSAGPKPATRRQARSCRRPDDRKAVRRR